MKSKRGFEDKLHSSKYGSRAQMVERAEFMFNEFIKEMDEKPETMDNEWVYHLCTTRDKAELINYILTGREIPVRQAENN